jgi:hypothetical protein
LIEDKLGDCDSIQIMNVCECAGKIFHEVKAGIFHSRGDSRVEWKIHLLPNENIHYRTNENILYFMFYITPK